MINKAHYQLTQPMKSFKLTLEGPPESGKSGFLERLLDIHWYEPSYYLTRTGCLEHELIITDNQLEPLPKEEEKMNEKYKLRNKITAERILNIGDSDCEEFRDEYSNFILWCTQKFGADFDFFAEILFHQIEPTLEYQPKWVKFLLENDLIEKVLQFHPYKAGDEFEGTSSYNSSRYKLIVVAEKHLLLIAKNGRSYFGTPAIHVSNVDEVTEEEFYKITRGKPKDFVKVEVKKHY